MSALSFVLQAGAATVVKLTSSCDDVVWATPLLTESHKLVRAAIYIITMLGVAGVACALAAALREVPLDERALGAASAGALFLYALWLARDWVLDLDCCTAPYHRKRARD